MTPTDRVPAHDDVRRGLLRANTAVGLVLTVVLGLALSSGMFAWRTNRLRAEAEAQGRRAAEAEATAKAELAKAYLSDARATRLGQDIARRPSALESLRRAAQIVASAELRQEAAAVLALPEFQLVAALPWLSGCMSRDFDADLRFCATGLTNGDIVLRAVDGGAEVGRLRREDGGIDAKFEDPSRVEFSPDGRRLSVRYRGGACGVWDWREGRLLFKHDAEVRWRPSDEPLFSSDGRHVVAPVNTPRYGIGVIEVETGRLVRLVDELDPYFRIAVRPGTTQFAGNVGTNVVLVNWETGRIEPAFAPGFAAYVKAWSPDGTRLAIGGPSLDVVVWNAATGERRTLPGHSADIHTLIFDPAGERLAALGLDGSTRFWDVVDGRLLGVTTEGQLLTWGTENRLGWERTWEAFEVRHMAPSPIYHGLVGPAEYASTGEMDVSPDGAWALTRGDERGLLAWDLRGADRPMQLPLPGHASGAFDATGQHLLLTRPSGTVRRSYRTEYRGAARVLVLGEAEALATNPPDSWLARVVPSRDGSRLAYSTPLAGAAWTGPRDPARPLLRVPDLALNSLAPHWSSLSGSGPMNLSPDGTWLACGHSGDYPTRIYEASTGKAVADLASVQSDVQFSPDGRWLVAAQWRGCQLFRVSDWKRVWELIHPRHYLRPCAAFSPDGALLAAARAPATIALIDASSGRLLTELEAPRASPIVALRWCRDGTLVAATRENRMDVWNPSVLRNELQAMGLDWDRSPAARREPPALAFAADPPISPARIIGAAGATVALVTVVAFRALRRHRVLIEDFTRTEALAAQRGRELEGEREISRLKSNFVSMVSHEFRTPLGVISVSSEVLQRYHERLSPAQRVEHLDAITQNVRRMARMMEDVLLLARVDSGRAEFRPIPVSLGSFCGRLVDEVLSATHRSCPMSLEAAPDLPATARADEAILRHILTNLLVNAAKYSTPGTPVVLRLRAEGEDAVFEVIDHGIGIPENDLPRLFHAFHRAGNVEHIRGSGLGLVIVKRCCDLHGGTVACASTLGAGTTFTVRLPLFREARPDST